MTPAAGSGVVRRRSARAILIDEAGQLLVIRRTRPGCVPYWTTPGGGLEASDDSLESALHRELAEELGARLTPAAQVFLHSTVTDAGLDVQHFFLTRLLGLNEDTRGGPEVGDPDRGGYHLERVDLTAAGPDGLAGLDLRPRALKEFLVHNREVLLIDATAMT